MILSARRPMIQLTALLDLLLIVMFAQYLEIKTASLQERETQAAKSAHEQERLEELERKIAAADTARLELEKTAADIGQLRTENQDLRQRQSDLTEAVKRTADQRDLLGQLAAELFKLPPELIDKVLKPSPGSETRLSPQDIANLKKTAKELAENRAGAMTRHLLTWSELRKRSDVWELTLDDSGLATFNSGDRQQQFRAATPDAFAREVFDLYKTAPQPKGLVIMLVSWGETPARWREAAIQGTRKPADMMREDSGGRSRFEYAILGLRPRDVR